MLGLAIGLTPGVFIEFESNFLAGSDSARSHNGTGTSRNVDSVLTAALDSAVFQNGSRIRTAVNENSLSESSHINVNVLQHAVSGDPENRAVLGDYGVVRWIAIRCKAKSQWNWVALGE